RATARPISGKHLFIKFAFSPDGKQLLTADDEDVVRLWDVAANRQIGPDLKARERIVEDFSIRVLSFSPKGNLLLIGGSGEARGEAGLWKVGVDGWSRVGTSISGSITAAVFSPGGDRLLAADATTARIFELPACKPAA